jgi:acyl-coenzyme A synthetase/AMP-(fatty) acid ligase
MAFVVLHPEHAKRWSGRPQEFEADMKRHAKSRLPGFATPEWVNIVTELPVSQTCKSTPQGSVFLQKSATGKILKLELRKLVAKL